MNGLFSPNFRVLNEPRYFRSSIRTIMRCLSSCLSTARTFAGINVIAAPSTSDFSESNTCIYRIYTCLGIRCIQLARADRALQTLLEAQSQDPQVFALGPPLSKSSSLFFARTHELLQYHFRTVTLAFEYDQDGRSRIAERLRFAHTRDGRGLRGHATLSAYSVRNHGAFSLRPSETVRCMGFTEPAPTYTRVV